MVMILFPLCAQLGSELQRERWSVESGPRIAPRWSRGGSAADSWAWANARRTRWSPEGDNATLPRPAPRLRFGPRPARPGGPAPRL